MQEVREGLHHRVPCPACALSLYMSIQPERIERRERPKGGERRRDTNQGKDRLDRAGKGESGDELGGWMEDHRKR